MCIYDLWVICINAKSTYARATCYLHQLLQWFDSIDLVVASDEKMSGIGKVYEVFIGEEI